MRRIGSTESSAAQLLDELLLTSGVDASRGRTSIQRQARQFRIINELAARCGETLTLSEVEDIFRGDLLFKQREAACQAARQVKIP